MNSNLLYSPFTTELKRNSTTSLSLPIPVRRFFVFMLWALALCLSSIQVHAQSSVLEQKITIQLKDMPLKDVLPAIADRANCRFAYSSSRLDANKIINASYQQVALREILEDIFGDKLKGLQVRNKNQIDIQLSEGFGSLQGQIRTAEGKVADHATVVLKGMGRSTQTDQNGNFSFQNIPDGIHTVAASFIGMAAQQKEVEILAGRAATVQFTLIEDAKYLSQIEVFGEREVQPDKLDAITRLPLKPSEQIQSISVISQKVIRQQGNLTVRDAVQNVPGVYTFATYSNTKESIASRGFRGIPTLKNGIRVYEDGLGQGFITDMEGVESIQVLKGSNAITQGLSADIGNSGGVVNVVTKTPKFENSGYASLRAGSWGLFRPSFDVQGTVNESKTVAFRIDGAYERSDSYRRGISSQKIYINPSLAIKPDDKTEIILEMDYFEDGRTPDAGTVNLGTNDVNAIYQLPYDQYLGFSADRYNTKNITYAARLNRKISDKLTLRAAYFSSDLRTNNQSVYLGTLSSRPLNVRTRSIIGSTVENANSVVQLDLVGREIYTGSVKHTFQVGMDYKTVDVKSYLPTNNLIRVDTIDIFEPINSKLKTGLKFNWSNTPAVDSRGKFYGVMAQDVITFNKYITAILGLRYSASENETISSYGLTKYDGWNPQLGLIVTPFTGLNVFGSYTNNTSINAANTLDVNGNPLEQSRYDQFEAGLKSELIERRLRFNLTLYQISNKNLPMRIYNGNVATPFYEKGGNDLRKGIEVELTGRILSNLDIIAGYAYIDAKYKDHTSYYYNSAPLNTPKHTYNAYANYVFENSTLKGLSLGAGVYYVGKRPVNDWSRVVDPLHGIQPGLKPFDVKSITTANIQAAYQVNTNWDLRLLANNIFDKIGYNAYRTAYINQTDPRNFSAVLTYRF